MPHLHTHKLRHVTSLSAFVATLLLAAPAFTAETALDRYVAKPDPNYKYELVSTTPGPGYTTYVLDLTSQQWRTSADVNKPIWKHWLTIVKPDQVGSTTGFLFITGGSVTDPTPKQPDPMLTSAALATHTVASELRGVPNEPLTFAGETKPRTEDAIIAYTWDKFLRTGDETWPLRLPMTKAAVRAMDTITAFCKSPQAGGVDVKSFLVSGGSKRGWTTWTTAAVDKRVIAIVPFVIDLLNMEVSFEHHFRAYGFYSPAVKDYEDLGTMKWSGTPKYRELLKIEEPYSYRDRLTLPKLIINATGDQYFLPDSSQFYFGDLKGEKHLRYVPNTNHSLRGSDARETMQAFYESVVSGTPRPKYSWKFEKDGSIHMKAGTKPAEVRLWQATNPKARDFRLDTIGKAYTSSVLEDQGGGVYVGKVPKPPQGYTAYFVEITFPAPGPGRYPFKFTSGVRVIPDFLPFPAPPKGIPPAQ
ncbi:MAG: PhoPQ-activated pathogenicity-related family protein [Acidobacteriota bacterium]|nr:PhoPQ-activated pathogenicity-related family protein [Acidobacteriota bacterium]